MLQRLHVRILALKEKRKSLENTVHKFGGENQKLLVSPKPDSHISANNADRNTGRNNSSCVYFNCSSTGNIRRRCNLASGSADPNATCQLC